MNRVLFRSRFGPLLGTATIWTGLAYAVLLAGAPVESLFARYPFGIAVMVGGIRLAWLAWKRQQNWTIVVDDEGIKTPQAMRWDAIDKLQITLEDLALGTSRRTVPVVRVESGETSLAFADLGPYGPKHENVFNLPTAPLLLAVIVAQSQAEPIYPASWTDSAKVQALPQAPELAVPPPSGDDGSFVQRFAGVLGLGAKLLPKIATTAFKLVSIIKPGAALLTMGVYSVMISWRFAVAFIVMVGFHECGHVYAMWRCNIPVKGIYFIPFFGGVAVGNARAPKAAQEGYIAINGPVWGTLLSAALIAVDWAIEPATPIFRVLGVWGALMNLFNLLPVHPLDGGQVLSALVGTRSFAPKIAGISLLVGAALAYFTGLDLLVLAVAVGFWEWTRLIALADEAPAFRLRGMPHLDSPVLEHFFRYCTMLAPGYLSASQVDARLRHFERFVQDAKREPMRRLQVLALVGTYFALVVTLLTILFTFGDSIDVGQPTDFLR